MRIAMLGLGLIGGSVARAAVASGHVVAAWTPSGAGPGAAVGDRIHAAASLREAVADAELVVIAAPPLAALELVDTLGTSEANLPAGAIVTDVTSTKRAIVERARSARLRFVGGHPLAGRETNGYGASDGSLFRDRPWVVVAPQPADPEAMDRVSDLVAACGARVVPMTAEDHDRAVAGISHLPLVVSAALAQSVHDGPDWSTAGALAAGGWEGMTRLARGDADMGAGILATNADAVAERLKDLSRMLDAWATDLRAADPGRLRRRLTAAREAAMEASPRQETERAR